MFQETTSMVAGLDMEIGVVQYPVCLHFLVETALHFRNDVFCFCCQVLRSSVNIMEERKCQGRVGR